jgi:hypothetical protein
LSKLEPEPSITLWEEERGGNAQLLGAVLENGGELLPAEIVRFRYVLAIARLPTEVSL